MFGTESPPSRHLLFATAPGRSPFFALHVYMYYFVVLRTFVFMTGIIAPLDRVVAVHSAPLFWPAILARVWCGACLLAGSTRPGPSSLSFVPLGGVRNTCVLVPFRPSAYLLRIRRKACISGSQPQRRFSPKTALSRSSCPLPFALPCASLRHAT